MKIKSITDVITNSSTEVFIIKTEDIIPDDKDKFIIFNSVEDVYKKAEECGDDCIDMCEVMYTFINYNDTTEYVFNIDDLLTCYGLGGLALELKMSLKDVLKFLEPLWKDRIVGYGYASFMDDCEMYPFEGNYKMLERR